MTNRPMRRADRATTHDETLTVLDAAPFVVISTVDDDGAPYGAPLSFVRRGNVLYVHATDQGGRKVDCFRRDARVCATAVTDVVPFYADGDFSTYYRSAMAFGRMREVPDGPEFKHALVDLCMKYVPQAREHIGEAMRSSQDHTSVWAVDIEELTGKAQPLPPTPSANADANTNEEG